MNFDRGKLLFLLLPLSLLAGAQTASEVPSSPTGELRTWTDASGKFRVEAEFLELVDGKVRLKGSNGKMLVILLERLSEEDRALVADLQKPAIPFDPRPPQPNPQPPLPAVPMPDEASVIDAQDELEVRHSDRVWRIAKSDWERIRKRLDESAPLPTESEPSTPAPTEMPTAPPPTSLTPVQPPQTAGLMAGIDRTLLYAAGGILGAALLLILGILYHFRVREPRRKRKPLMQAITLLNNDQRDQFEVAERLLVQSLSAGLAPADVAEARFALGYVRARLGKLTEAEATLADLRASGIAREDNVYLELWVQAKHGDHKEVNQLYNEHCDLLKSMLQTPLLASISLLARGKEHWECRQVEAALHYFDQVRELGVLVEHLPAQIDEHQIVFGLQGLFQDNLLEARKHFEGAVQEGTTKGVSTLKARIGILLCEWRNEEGHRVAKELEQILSELNAEMAFAGTEVEECLCEHCAARQKVRTSSVGSSVCCASCGKRFKAASVSPFSETAESENPPEPLPIALDNDESLLRGLLLWRALAMVVSWKTLPAKSPLPAAERKALDSLLSKTLERNPKSSDALLLSGLVAYYFANNDAERLRSVEVLEKACTCGVNLVEVFGLCEQERKLAKQQADYVNRYLTLIKTYLTNDQVPVTLREKLKEKLHGIQRFQSLEEMDVTSVSDSAPSTQDLHTRATMIGNRLDSILKGQNNAEHAAEVRKLMDGFGKEAEQLEKQARTFETAEVELLGVAGQFLLNEEPQSAISNGAR